MYLGFEEQNWVIDNNLWIGGNKKKVIRNNEKTVMGIFFEFLIKFEILQTVRFKLIKLSRIELKSGSLRLYFNSK